MKSKSCSLKRALKQLDIYGKPIQLTYKGKNKFTSSLGGFVSLIVLLFLISLFLYKLQDMFKRTQTSVKKNTLVRISNSYSSPEVLSSKNITFAFMISDYYGEGQYDDPYYGTVKLTQESITIVKNQTDGTSYRTFDNQKIPFSKCQLGKNIFYDNAEEISQYGIEKYYCPDWQNLTIQGNWYSPEFKTIILEFERCQQVVGCATDAEFNQWIKKITVQEVFISTYFDIADYTNPIHYFLDDAYISMQNGRSVLFHTYYKRNKLKLYDEFFSLFTDPILEYFYSLSHNNYYTGDDVYGPGKGIYFQQSIRLDKEYDTYERSVYTVTGVLQDVGGFYNSLFFIGLMLFGKIQNTLFFSSLFSRIYQVECPGEFTKLQGQRDNPCQKQQQDLEKSSIKTNQVSYHNISTRVISAKIKEKLSLTTNHRIDKDFIRLIKEFLLRRIRLDFTLKNLLQLSVSQYFPCCYFKKRKYDKQQDYERNKYAYFEVGSKRIMEEFDCVNLLNKMRQLSIMESLLLTRNQKFLIKYSKKELLDPEDSSSTDEENAILLKYQKEINQQRTFHVYKQLIKQQVLMLNEHFTDFDRKILYSLISKNPMPTYDNEQTQKVLKSKQEQDMKQSIPKLPYQVPKPPIKQLPKKTKQRIVQPTIGINDLSIDSEMPLEIFDKKTKSKKGNKISSKTTHQIDISDSFTDDHEQSRFTLKYKKTGKSDMINGCKMKKDKSKVFQQKD